jgi:2-polyprenyl-3-methyl-5-hydroxy-6-metoxy-1,4-benzoquinol methylase
MAHDHGKHGHDHTHDHTHDHGHHEHSHLHDHHHGDEHGHHQGPHAHEHHDHHHHDHGGHHHHDWHSEHYVGHWVDSDARRHSERAPIITRLVAAVPFGNDTQFTMLDVGAGSGVIADALLQSFPHARIVLQDYSAPMLTRARARFGDRGEQVRYALCDLQDAQWVKKVGGPFDLVLSGIAIHNLQDMAKIAACYEGVCGLLKPDGCFIDYDYFDWAGGIALHQHMLRVAGFNSVDVLWHEHPTAVVKATR